MSRNFCERIKVDLLIDFLFNRKEGHEYASMTNDIETRLPLHESTSPVLRPHLHEERKESEQNRINPGTQKQTAQSTHSRLDSRNCTPTDKNSKRAK